MDLEILRNMAVKVRLLHVLEFQIFTWNFFFNVFYCNFSLVSPQEEEEVILKSTRREKARADAAYMQQVMIFLRFFKTTISKLRHEA